MTRRLLLWVGPVHIVAGLLLFASGFIAPLYELMVQTVVVRSDFQWSPFFAAILGPTIASWGVLFAAVAAAYYEQATLARWRSLFWALLIWAPLDTLLCLEFGFYGGAIVNSIVFVAIILLLLSARREIK